VHQAARPQAVIAFAGRGDLSAPALRVARVASIGTPEDVFTTSALTWGHSILASVQYSDAKRVFNAAVTAYAEAAVADDSALAAGGFAPDAPRVPSQDGLSPAGAGRPGGSWPVGGRAAGSRR
jgi:hypothetical protein